MEEIVNLLEQGKVFGFEPEKPKVISTGSSYVFIFPINNIALKLYRRDNEHWNTYFSDMSEGDARRNFIMKDYEWNHTYSPDIYFGIKQVKVSNDGFVELSEDLSGDEFIIEMKIVNKENFLMNVLKSDQLISTEEFYSIGKQVAEITKNSDLKQPSNKNFYEIMLERVDDVMSWMKSLNYFDESFTGSLENYLRDYTENKKSFYESLTDENFVAVIDFHAENAVYKNGKISCIDVLLPKELWRTSRVNENFSRIGADIAVLRGKEAFESYRSGFMDITPFDNSDEIFDQVYNASIMLCAQVAYSFKDKSHVDLVDKYKSFISENLV